LGSGDATNFASLVGRASRFLPVTCRLKDELAIDAGA
jgi:hypothetical protein